MNNVSLFFSIFLVWGIIQVLSKLEFFYFIKQYLIHFNKDYRGSYLRDLYHKVLRYFIPFFWGRVNSTSFGGECYRLATSYAFYNVWFMVDDKENMRQDINVIIITCLLFILNYLFCVVIIKSANK